MTRYEGNISTISLISYLQPPTHPSNLKLSSAWKICMLERKVLVIGVHALFSVYQNDDRVLMDVFTVRQSGLNCWLEASVSTLSQLVFSVSVCIDTTVTHHSQYIEIDTLTETRAGF